MLIEGMRVRIKKESWERNLPNSHYPYYPEQTIISVGWHPPFDGKYMLSFPVYWWDEDDLEVVANEVDGQ